MEADEGGSAFADGDEQDGDAEVARVLVEVVREHQPIGAREAERLVGERLGRAEEPDLDDAFDVVEDELLDDGPLAMIPPDRLLHVPSLLEGVVLTHRVTGEESVVLLAGDLPGFGYGALSWQGERVSEYVGDDGRTRWLGPEGWLDDLVTGTLLAVSVDATGELSLRPLDAEPALDDASVATVRAAYDAEVAQPWLPVSAEDLLVGVLAADRTAFARPVPPLPELAAAAGLERRGEEYAHEESVWQQARAAARHYRLFDRLGPGPAARTAAEVLDLLDEGIEDVATARRLLGELHDPDVVPVVAHELLGDGDEHLASFTTLAERLLAAASRPAQRAAAHWLVAVARERSGSVLDAEAHLRDAVREDPGWPCAEDRLAWYESDRGDAVAALDRWRRLGATARSSQDVATLEAVVAATSPAVQLGRNERCWCGSGRKYKVCHLGRPERPPLPDRVSWLCRKAVAYLERHGDRARELVLDHAASRATDPDDLDAVHAALDDPLVLDAVLHEEGWFARFVTDRGPLLPDDEAMLARSWTFVERSVVEVLDVVAGEGLTVRDLRTGDRHDVRERALSRDARVGELLRARVVPDGGRRSDQGSTPIGELDHPRESHQLVGGVFRVPPGRETSVLEMLDEHDGHELLAWVRELHRPPTLVTQDGDPLLDCRTELRVPDPERARVELDHRYERSDDDAWVSLVPSADGTDDGRTVRAWLELDRDALTVRALSEQRFDAVLAELRDAFPGVEVIHEGRSPFDPGEPSAAPTGAAPTGAAPTGAAPTGAAPTGAEIPAEVLVELVERQERRWCDEQVPALGGRTPQEAAADPTRREEVERLIASFPDPDPDSGVVGLRPARLRELLDLDG